MRILISLFFIFLSCSNVLAKDSVWNKALEVSEKNKNYRAKNIVMYIDDLNKDGDVVSSQEIHQKIRQSNEIKYDTIKVLKDGKDITEESLKKRKEQKNKRASFLEDNDIFSMKVQNKITSEKIGSQLIDGFVTHVYSYSYNKNDKENYQGKAWINTKTGEPIKIEYTMNPLPMGLKNLTVLYNYETQNNKTYIKTIKANGEASFLLFKKIFRMKVDLKNYKQM
jgi:hypothetical protein